MANTDENWDLEEITENDDADETEDAYHGTISGRVGAQEIPYHEWPTFFDTFTRNHEGETVFVELDHQNDSLSATTEVEIMVHDLPLIGITADLGDGPEGTIQIIAGDEPEDHITHTVTRPTHVWMYQEEDGEDEILEIEAVNGPSTLVHF